LKPLQPITHSNQRILTTAQLAEAYEADAQLITNNFNRNKDRYTPGKHYFLLEGDELTNFKEATHQFDLSTKSVNKLYLWTEKGALMHAKSLNTDKAWAAYELLVDEYYRLTTEQPIAAQLEKRVARLEQLIAKKQPRLLEQTASEAREWESFLSAWVAAYKDNWKMAREMHALYQHLPLSLKKRMERQGSTFTLILGKALKKRINTIYGNYRIETDMDTHVKVRLWRVTTLL